MNSDEDMEYVAYLGTVEASGVVYRADMYRDDEGYLARQTATCQDGRLFAGTFRVAGAEAVHPIETAVLSLMNRMLGDGVDLDSINVIHPARAVSFTEPLLH